MPLLLLLLTLPGFTPEDTIRVHEWGVVLYQGEHVAAVGAYPCPDDPYLYEAKAPVITFHGPTFSGDVTVVSLGEIFSVYPRPDLQTGPCSLLGGLGSFIRWKGIRASQGPPEVVDEVAPYDLPVFHWAVGHWRDPDALLLERGDGFLDRFLYYEVDLTGTGFPHPLTGFAPDGFPRAGEALLFHRDENGVRTYEFLHGGDLSSTGTTGPFLYDPEGVRAVLSGWAEGILTPTEIRGMWATWEPEILHGSWEGTSLAVFPLPEEAVEKVSTLLVRNDQGYPVTLHRFYLGILPLP